MFCSALYRSVGKASWGFGTAVLYVAIGIGGAVRAAPFGVLAVAVVWVARAYLLLPLHIVLVRRLSGLPTSRLLLPMRSAERTVGKACVSPFGARWCAYH